MLWLFWSSSQKTQQSLERADQKKRVCTIHVSERNEKHCGGRGLESVFPQTCNTIIPLQSYICHQNNDI